MDSIDTRKDKRCEPNLRVKAIELSEQINRFLISLPKIWENNSEVEIILREGCWTQILKEYVDFGNVFVLYNFNLNLSLEAVNKYENL